METMRRRDRSLSDEEALCILNNGEYGVLGTVRLDGQPYAVPLSYTYQDNKIYFHCALEGYKIRNIQHNPKVCFTVVGKTQPVYDTGFSTYYESAMAFGVASEVLDKEEKSQALYALALKYLPEHMDKAGKDIEKSFTRTAVYVIQVSQVTGKAKRPNA